MTKIVNIYECTLNFSSTLGPYIARKRTSEVQKKYAEIGGGSPILKWTNLQVRQSASCNYICLKQYKYYTHTIVLGQIDVWKVGQNITQHGSSQTLCCIQIRWSFNRNNFRTSWKVSYGRKLTCITKVFFFVC